MRRLVLCIYSMLLFPYFQIIAQQKDFGLWTSFEAEKKIVKNLEAQMGFSNRLKDNLNQRDETYADIGISYRYRILDFGTGYRFTNNNKDMPDFVYSHRLIYQLRLRPDWDRISFDLRARYQSQYFGLQSSETGKIPENFFRNRVKVSYDIKKSDFEPSASYELFYRLSKYLPAKYERSRLTMGLEYSINKNNAVELSYILYQTFNNSNPTLNHIVSLQYKIEI